VSWCRSVPLWLFTRIVIFRIDICSFQGLLFSFNFSLCFHNSCFVKSPSLILLHSDFQGCAFRTVFYFPLPCSVYLFLNFIYHSFLVFCISFSQYILSLQNAFLRATGHHSFPHFSKPLHLVLSVFFLFHSVLLLPTSTIASLPSTLDLPLSGSSFNGDRFKTVCSQPWSVSSS